MIREEISDKKLRSNLEAILNLKISRAWKGYGSSLFLELGDLHEELAWKKGKEPTTTSVGEFTLSSPGSWSFLKRVKDSNRGINMGKIHPLNIKYLEAENATGDEIKKLIKDLESLTIESIELNEKLTLNLSNDIYLEFNKVEHGFFTLVSNIKPFIDYENNSAYTHHVIL